MRVAVVNVGSMTVKTALAEVRAGRPVDARARVAVPIGPAGDVAGAVREALARVGARPGEVDALGHRVVHGGERFREPVRVDEEVEAAIEALVPLAPLHNAAALTGIRTARVALPGVPEVAVFDTAFHAGRPPESIRYALPVETADALGIRRYGFHGIAHESLVRSLAGARGVHPAEIDAVTLQLGAGASACAVRSGRSIETSMGFTPLEGLPMATRSGDVDPGAVLHLLRSGLDVEEVDRLLRRDSGLLGLTGSADLREILRREARGDEPAGVALRLYVRRIALTTGAYLTLLGGRSAIVFGGGVGTNSAEIRRRVAAELAEAWDVALDPERNASGVPGRVSTADARPVWAIETDEERLIAEAVGTGLEA